MQGGQNKLKFHNSNKYEVVSIGRLTAFYVVLI